MEKACKGWREEEEEGVCVYPMGRTGLRPGGGVAEGSGSGAVRGAEPAKNPDSPLRQPETKAEEASRWTGYLC